MGRGLLVPAWSSPLLRLLLRESHYKTALMLQMKNAETLNKQYVYRKYLERCFIFRSKHASLILLNNAKP